MASKEELEAMGIKVMQCKECCKDISEQEYNSHKGYCKSCYKDRHNIENIKKYYNQSVTNSINYKEESTTNTVAKIIKIIAILETISGIILGLIFMEDLEIMVIVVIVASLISGVFIYAIGEIIQLLEDIKNK